MQDETTRIHEEIESLRQMSVGQLKEKYREVFGEETRSNHKQFLFRRDAWRLQANAWGGLQELMARLPLTVAAPSAVCAVIPAFRIGGLYHI